MLLEITSKVSKIRNLLVACFALLFSLFLMSFPCYPSARSGTEKDTITAEQIVQAKAEKIPVLVQSCTSDLRSSLRLIVRAYEIGCVEKAALQYYDMLQAEKNNPKLMAEYAFAYLLAGENDNLRNATNEQRMLKDKLLKYPYQPVAVSSRVSSIKLLPASPEVLIMAAAEAELISVNYQKSLTLTKKAIRIDPNWGYAHYRAGKALVGMIGKELVGAKRQDTADDYARQALQEFDVAKRLDKTIEGRGVSVGYAHAYGQLRQYDKAVRYLDQAIASTDRKHASYERLVKWRQQLTAQ